MNVDQAACAGCDTELWFPAPSERGDEAREVCATCPIVVECREFAVARPKLQGIWGGLSEQERYEVRTGRTSRAEVEGRYEQRRERERQRERDRKRQRPREINRPTRDGELKRCSTCREWMHERFYYADRTRPDGLSARCRACHRTRVRGQRRRQREAV